MNLKSLLKHKILLYVAYVLALVNVVGYLQSASYQCVAVFAVSYYVLTLMKINNRALEILGALLVANLLFGCGRLREGAKNKEDKEDAEEKAMELVKKLGGGAE